MAARRAPAACLSLSFLFLLSACDFYPNSTSASNVPATTQPGSGSNVPATPPPGSGTTTGTGSVTLSWSAPSQNTDGTPLTDLAGYHVYYSQAPWGWTDMLDVRDPSASTVQVAKLATGTTWYFALATYNASGVESTRTGWVSKML